MAQIVINISDGTYNRCKNERVGLLPFDIPEVCDAIKNGTPLPKGHGKLIAEPTEEDIAKTVGGQNDFTECIKDAVKAVFDNADAIIEADKTESEGE